MPAFISINGHTIRQNAKNGTDVAPIRIARIKSDKKPRYCHEVAISGPCRLVYDGERKLNCGARLVLVVPDYDKVRIVR